MSDDLFDFFKKSKHHGKRNHGGSDYDDHDRERDRRDYEHHQGYYNQARKNHDSHDGLKNVGYSRGHSSQHGGHFDLKHHLISKVLTNPKILVIALFVVLLLTGLVVILLISIFPLISSLLTTLSKGGLKDIVDLIWKGVGK